MINTKTKTPKAKKAPSRSQVAPELRTSSKKSAPAVNPMDISNINLSEDAPDGEGMGVWKKAVLLLATAASTAVGMAQTAAAAPAASLAVRQTQDIGMEVMLLPRGTPRIDLVRQTEMRYQGGDQRERDIPYSDVGVHLGDGLFHDVNGNLSLVPALKFGHEVGATDFRRIDMDVPGWDESVVRFGNTVHYSESPYTRHVFAEVGGTIRLSNKQGEQTYEQLQNGVQFRSEEGVHWRVTRDGQNIHIDGPGENDSNIFMTEGVLRVSGQRNRRTDAISLDSSVQINGYGPDSNTRYGSQTTVEVGGPMNDYTITPTADGYLVEGSGLFEGDRRISIDNPDELRKFDLNYRQLVEQIEAAEPGYSERHPLVMALLEYAVANPGLVGEEEPGSGLFQAGTAIAGAGGALQSGRALIAGSEALSLAGNAQALGASALAAKAAAQAAAQAGNLGQAAALAAQAQEMGNQARALGAEAMEIGKGAQHAAEVARIMTGVAGALEIIDGGMDLHRGASNKSIVEGAIDITEAQRILLSETLTGADLEQAMEDYTKVMEILAGLKKNANKQITVGGLKIGCGGLMLISALVGGAVLPPIIGAVGLACTAGTAAYEHWDQIEAFFKGEEYVPDPTLREMLPVEVRDNDLILEMD